MTRQKTQDYLSRFSENPKVIRAIPENGQGWHTRKRKIDYLSRFSENAKVIFE